MNGQNEKKMVKAKYISDIKCDKFVKDGVYDVFLLPKCPQVIGFYDYAGEEYALPASRFEIIEDKD